MLKIIELDDDETLHSTGLENAIRVDELTKEDNENNIIDEKVEVKEDNLEILPQKEEVKNDPIVDEIFSTINIEKKETDNELTVEEPKINKENNINESIIETEKIPTLEVKQRESKSNFFSSKKNIFK